jgi:septum formation protein
MSESKLHLASSSPRRRRILERMGLEFTAAGVDVDERQLPEESAASMVVRLAVDKACAVTVQPGVAVLGADTAVVLDGEVFGKPADQADALRMLARLSGRRHQVMTGVAVRSAGATNSVLSVTEVTFREIDPDEARDYWQSGEPAGKAGAYAIQGRGGAFVESIAGSYTGVVGLPVAETAELLRWAGIEVPADLKDAL